MSSLRRVVLFNRFFYPDSSATSQMASDLAFGLAGLGFDVHAVCTASGPNELRTSQINGVTIHRVAAGGHNPSMFAKGTEYVHYYLGARRKARELLCAGGIAIIKTDPPLLSAFLSPSLSSRDIGWINWLQDLFPEVAQRYGIPGSNLPVLRQLRDRAVRNAAATVIVAEGMRSYLPPDSERRGPIHAIPNWSRGNEITPISFEVNSLRREYKVDREFVVGYAGNLGRVHEFDTLVGAASLLKDSDDIKFVVAGGGPKLAAVKEEVQMRQLTNIRFIPPQPGTRLNELLGMPDVHLCALKPEFEGLVMPSKLYGIFAAGRPSIFIGATDGEASRLIEEAGCGIAVATGDSKGLSQAIVRLKNSQNLRDAMGQRARQIFLAQFDFPIALKRWEQLINSVFPQTSP